MAHPTGLRLTDYAKSYAWPQHTAMRIRAAAGRTGDLTDLRGDSIWQADDPGAAPRMGLRIYTKFRGIEMPDVSDQALYTLGRLQEWAGTNPDLEPELVDNGADPAWVLTAAQSVGLIFARDGPGPGAPGHDVAKRNPEPPRELLASAWARRGLLFHQVTWAPGTLREQIDQLTSRRTSRARRLLCGRESDESGRINRAEVTAVPTRKPYRHLPRLNQFGCRTVGQLVAARFGRDLLGGSVRRPRQARDVATRLVRSRSGHGAHAHHRLPPP